MIDYHLVIVQHAIALHCAVRKIAQIITEPGSLRSAIDILRATSIDSFIALILSLHLDQKASHPADSFRGIFARSIRRRNIILRVNNEVQNTTSKILPFSMLMLSDGHFF